MFEGCKKFESDLSKWSVNSVVSMERMFYGCEKFKPGLFGWQRFGLSDDDDDDDISEYDNLFR